MDFYCCDASVNLINDFTVNESDQMSNTLHTPYYPVFLVTVTI